MPFCPICLSEYRAGVVVCKSCDDTPLVEVLTNQGMEPDIQPGEQTAAIHIVTGEAEDSLVEIDGEEYNLACIHPLSRARDFMMSLASEKIASVILEIPKLRLVGDQPAYEVHVRAERIGEALDVIRGLWESLTDTGESLEDISAETCPACGAEVPLDVEECPECGLMIGFGEDFSDDEDE